MLLAFYNITWESGKLEGRNRAKHLETLRADLGCALLNFHADAVMLSECGEVDIGLEQHNWIAIIQNICGPGFAVAHQSHYTSIIRVATLNVLSEPKLMGPMTPLDGHG